MILASALVALALVLVLGAALVLARILGRRVISQRERTSLPIVDLTETTLTMPATEETLQPGRYGLWNADQSEYALIGEVVTRDPEQANVTRRVLSLSTTPQAFGSDAVWTGHVFRTPTDVVPDARELTIDTPAGECPAWFLPAHNPGRTWAIHVHGIRTTRITALRTVPAALEAGLPSLVVSFRGDGEGPETTPAGISHLGSTEWEDIDAAIGHAIANGAEDVVIFGWSMGATASLIAAERGLNADRVRAMVLIGPAVDWSATIAAGARKAHLPGVLGALAFWALTTPGICRLTGLTSPLPRRDLVWTKNARIDLPIFVIHSPADRDLPIDASREFVAQSPFRRTLQEFAGGALHCWEYNHAPEVFNGAISSFLAQLPRNLRE
ncbi:alpha/beta hydrolase [Agromyces sp. Soil535]|uniref:alpha/beta hydrolase n=1 Tax=Agromyces sp. Soil535 TaxID=1736390 RepID=UPI0006FD3E56|nr:alpha/beta fold hydrolase [Agromyces sp. Soil535]KRE28238.1 hypothetical protein ASG80_21400 [Agromyces sp. Soil535]